MPYIVEDDDDEEVRQHEHKEALEARTQLKAMMKLAKASGVDERWAADALMQGRQEEFMVKIMAKYGVEESDAVAALRSGDDAKIEELTTAAMKASGEEDTPIDYSDYGDIMDGLRLMGHDPNSLEAQMKEEEEKEEARRKAEQEEKLARNPHLALLNERVSIIGLTGRPELNGQFGKATKFDEEKGRFAVKLESGKEKVLLRPVNLEKAPPAPSLEQRMGNAMRADQAEKAMHDKLERMQNEMREEAGLPPVPKPGAEPEVDDTDAPEGLEATKQIGRINRMDMGSVGYMLDMMKDSMIVYLEPTDELRAAKENAKAREAELKAAEDEAEVVHEKSLYVSDWDDDFFYVIAKATPAKELMARVREDFYLPKDLPIELLIAPHKGGGLLSSSKPTQMQPLNRMAKFWAKRAEDKALHVELRLPRSDNGEKYPELS